MENIIKQNPDMVKSLVEVTLHYAETNLRHSADGFEAANNVSNMCYVVQKALDLLLEEYSK